MSQTAKAKNTDTCILQILTQERLRGVLPGLVLQEDGPEPVLKQLPCCGGRGIRFDAEFRQAQSCDVRSRLERLRRLMHVLRVSSDGKRDLSREIQQVNPQALHLSLRRFAAYKRRMASSIPADKTQEAWRGLLFPLSPLNLAADARRPLSMWALAAAGIWRMGLDVRVVTLGQRQHGGFLQFDQMKGSPHALLVEGVDRLWDPVIADQFEAIVSYAYKSMVPLWLELIVRDEAGPGDDVQAGMTEAGKQGGAGFTSQAWKKRIQGLRSKPPLFWLEADACSKLAEICDGVQAYMLDKSKGEAKEAKKTGLSQARIPGSLSHKPKPPHFP